MSQYPSNRSRRPAGDYARSTASAQPGISRSSSRSSYGARPASGSRSSYGSRPASSSRSAYGSRPSGQRPSGSGQRRPGNQRPGGGNRRPPNGGRRPNRKPKGRFYAFLALALVLVVAIILIVVKPGGDKPVTPVTPTVEVTPQPPVDNGGQAGFNVDEIEDTTPVPQTQYSSIADMLADSDAQVEGLSADKMVQVEGLAVNQSLPSDWMNVLLLGTDERKLGDSARTDAVMICSINTTTGEVKLTSIMRDLGVTFNDIGEYNGTYGINAANFFGGPKLAIRTVNQLFGMNIQNYVMVNFFGFGKIAQALGGVEVNLSKEEMDIINEDIREQYKMAYLAGITDFDTEQVEVTNYGENIHLNGNQTLAYARIRHLDGGDYMRTTRQQTVLSKLLGKAKKLNALEMVQLANEFFPWVKTNMQLEDILNVAYVVIANGMTDLETFRLPVQGTYKEEVRNEKSLLWDCDFATNATKLYDFIYE